MRGAGEWVPGPVTPLVKELFHWPFPIRCAKLSHSFGVTVLRARAGPEKRVHRIQYIGRITANDRGGVAIQSSPVRSLLFLCYLRVASMSVKPRLDFRSFSSGSYSGSLRGAELSADGGTSSLGTSLQRPLRKRKAAGGQGISLIKKRTFHTSSDMGEAGNVCSLGRACSNGGVALGSRTSWG